MRWVSVKKRLPNYEEDVLVTDGHKVMIAWFNPDTEIFQPVDLKEFMEPITHWSVCPKLPKKHKIKLNIRLLHKFFNFICDFKYLNKP